MSGDETDLAFEKMMDGLTEIEKVKMRREREQEEMVGQVLLWIGRSVAAGIALAITGWVVSVFSGTGA